MDWFDSFAFLYKRPPLFIIRQENFISDMSLLLKILNIDFKVQELVDSDPKKTHKNNYLGTDPLSELAIKNLKRWYLRDNFFIRFAQTG